MCNMNVLCDRNICDKSGVNCPIKIEDRINSNDEFIHYIKHLKCRVTDLVRKQIKKNMSNSRRINHSNLDDPYEFNYTSSEEFVIPIINKNKKIQFDKKDDKNELDKKSPRKNLAKDSTDLQNHLDSGLGTSQLDPEYTLSTFDDSTLLTSTQITPSDLSNTEITPSDFPSFEITPSDFANAIQPDQVSPIQAGRPDRSPVRLLSSRRRETSKFVDKASSAITTPAPIPEIPSTWTQRSIAMANHVRRRFYQRIHAFVAALIVGVLVWMALIYGALLGATLCNYGRLSIFPESSLHSKPPMVFY